MTHLAVLCNADGDFVEEVAGRLAGYELLDVAVLKSVQLQG